MTPKIFQMNFDGRQIGINHLPDEILEKILIEATISLEGSMIAAAVCKRWRRIMVTRLAMVRYLLQDQWSIDSGYFPDEGKVDIPKASYLFLHENGSHPSILKTCLEWLPNLMVIEVCRPNTVEEEESLLRCIASKKNIVGFSWYPKYNRSQGAVHIPQVQLTNVDMLAIFEEPFALTHTTLFYCCHQSLSQLYISNENWSPAVILPRFWNLRRLHMLYHDRENVYPRLLAYSGPVLYKLEILELSFAVESMFDHLTHLLLFCPNLKSLFLQIEGGHHNLDDVSSSRRFFETVENLIIEISKSWVSHCKFDDWVCFMELVRMFPNLKNLGLRNVHNLTEDLIVSALQWSFNLKLLDIKLKTNSSSGNDSFPSEPSIKAENIASCFFWRHRQRLTCLVRPYEDDYESVSVQTGTWHVKEGFDFMTHVFPRNFSFSPVFLVDYNSCEN